MSLCTDPIYHDMLHAWELGMLSDDDRQGFEMHLLQCDTCAGEAGQLLQASRLLRNDPDFRPSSGDISVYAVSDRSGQSIFASKIVRSLLVAAALLILAVSVSKLIVFPDRTTETMQRIRLVPVRGSDEAVIDRHLGGRVEISFYAEGVRSEDTYRVIISSSDGTTVYADNHFRHFGDLGGGTISLPSSKLPEGIATLIISPATDSLVILQQYFFRVK